ncbi:hypothetical protein SEA_OCTOBIEN14_84 [Gordonia phage Octobien14]|uniref:Uncharacterized protein n=1 Tax=Gordonia phage Octobien14 TaxID=2483673 RepID=A0A3G3MAX7_9CAUD|nr:hypothetical protein L3Y22_gp084 [Gordonia phage Octobien14]AYR03228.1 hypothetical protein SEA_OCTOBIEN14_84 [Gordonia phage Octobien14]
MKYYGGRDPHAVTEELPADLDYEHLKVLWDAREQQRYAVADWMQQATALPTEVHMDEDVAEKLRRVATREKLRPDAAELADQIPDVVGWLRARMTMRGQASDDEVTSHAKPGSKPPFRLAYMSAADREVAALAYWCAHYGIYPSSPMWRVDGQVAGVFPDHLDCVSEMAKSLSEAIRGRPLAEGIYTDPEFGLWAVRSSHYAVWPELATIFEPELVAKALPETQESLF